jgi:hypothetical protein
MSHVDPSWSIDSAVHAPYPIRICVYLFYISHIEPNRVISRNDLNLTHVLTNVPCSPIIHLFRWQCSMSHQQNNLTYPLPAYKPKKLRCSPEVAMNKRSTYQQPSYPYKYQLVYNMVSHVSLLDPNENNTILICWTVGMYKLFESMLVMTHPIQHLEPPSRTPLSGGIARLSL